MKCSATQPWLPVLVLLLAGFGLRVFQAGHQENCGETLQRLTLAQDGSHHVALGAIQVSP
jgi:hypothetical protein